MELTTPLDRMKLEHLAAQLDAVCKQAAEAGYSVSAATSGQASSSPATRT